MHSGNQRSMKKVGSWLWNIPWSSWIVVWLTVSSLLNISQRLWYRCYVDMVVIFDSGDQYFGTRCLGSGLSRPSSASSRDGRVRSSWGPTQPSCCRCLKYTCNFHPCPGSLFVVCAGSWLNTIYNMCSNSHDMQSYVLSSSVQKYFLSWSQMEACENARASQ